MSMLSRFATTGGSGDPYWANVSYLLVGNGANGTTTNIKDSSSNNLATTISGNTAITTSQSKYGSGSVYFDGSGDYLTLASTSLLTFGTGAFTVEMWFYQTVTTDYEQLFVTCNSYLTSGCFRLYTGPSNNKLEVSVDTRILLNPVTTFLNNTWNYVAVCRAGSTLTMYLNGVNIASITDTTSFISNNSMIGGVNGGLGPFSGYIYDLRVTKGVARYSGSTMTVPTAPLPIG